jgi:hypothetical protein
LSYVNSSAAGSSGGIVIMAGFAKTQNKTQRKIIRRITRKTLDTRAAEE